MEPFDLRQWAEFIQAGGSSSSPAVIDQITLDSRRIYSPHTLFVALKGSRQDGHQFVQQAAEAGAKFAIVRKEWQGPTPPHLTLLRVDDPLKSLQNIAKTYREQFSIKVIAITGSFGKTMVKDLLTPLLATQKKVVASPESFNSQIGVALSLLTIKKEHEVAIIEAAISKKEEMDVLTQIIQPDYTILTPIGKKHLATLENLTTITNETLKLIRATSQKGWSLIPSQVSSNLHDKTFPTFLWDIPHCELPHASLMQNQKSYQITFPNQTHYFGQIKTDSAYYLNLINMAAKAAWLYGISSFQIGEVLTAYSPEPTRTEIWKSPTGTLFVNDTYCSDPLSVDTSLHLYRFASANQKRIFVFGGMRETNEKNSKDYERIGKALSKVSLKNLYLWGEKPFKPLIEEMEKNSNETEILQFSNEQELLNHLKGHLKENDLVIFKGDKKFPLEGLTEIFNDSQNHNQCLINFAAIQNNIEMIRAKLHPGTSIMFMVKALAYGTDDVRMAKFLSSCGIDRLGVSYVDEAIALKRAGVEQSLFSLNVTYYEAAKAVKWEIELGVSNLDLTKILSEEASRQGKIIKVHLHVDTGMGRFGCRPEEALTIAQFIEMSPSLQLEGIMTHLPCADNPEEDAFTRSQMTCFDQIIQELETNGISPPFRHAANSSGAIRFSMNQYNMVRIGLAAYGLYLSDDVKNEMDLRLALSLTSRIVGINHCKKGDTISYGRNYKVEQEEERIAVLPIGYYDGLHRHYSGKAHVLIHGKKAPMVGNICMDYMMVNVTDIPEAAIGDKALIFGEDEYGHYISPEELAGRGNSIIHELMTCLGPRIQRIFIYEESFQIR